MAQPSSPATSEAAIQVKYDAETRRIFELTARRLRDRITRMGSSFSANIRKAQLTLVLNQLERMLEGTFTGPLLNGVVQPGREDAMRAAQAATEALTAPLYAGLNPDIAEILTDGLRLAADSAIRNAMAHVPRPLSARVWANGHHASGKMTEMIRTGLASGLTAREMAAEVYSYVSPTTPGGASYAAMRLARTEINNAFHERQKEGAKRPGVKRAIWNLSGSHKVPDECNVYAKQRYFEADAIPDKPHPQCFCYLTYETMTMDEFTKSMATGGFDDELDRRTKRNLAGAGVAPPTGGTPPPPSLKPGEKDVTVQIRQVIAEAHNSSVNSAIRKKYNITIAEAFAASKASRAGERVIVTPGTQQYTEKPTRERKVAATPKAKPTTRPVPPRNVEIKPAPVGTPLTEPRVGQPYKANLEINRMLGAARIGTAEQLARRYGITVDEAKAAFRNVMLGEVAVIVPRQLPRGTANQAPAAPSRKSPDAIINRIHREADPQVSSELRRQIGLAPFAMARLKRVQILDDEEQKLFAQQVGANAVAAYRGGAARRIQLTKRIFGKAADRRAQESIRSGWYSQCGHNIGHAEKTVAHECGHHIAAEMWGGNRNPQAYYNIIKVAAQELGLSPPPSPYGYAGEDSLNPWVTANKRKITSGLSRYGSTNIHEFFAEVWAEYSTNPNGARPWVNRVGAMMQELTEQSAKAIS